MTLSLHLHPQPIQSRSFLHHTIPRLALHNLVPVLLHTLRNQILPISIVQSGHECDGMGIQRRGTHFVPEDPEAVVFRAEFFNLREEGVGLTLCEPDRLGFESVDEGDFVAVGDKKK
jgi:hypothetical protein